MTVEAHIDGISTFLRSEIPSDSIEDHRAQCLEKEGGAGQMTKIEFYKSIKNA